MKKITWDTVLKIVIAMASALLGALSAHAMTILMDIPVMRKIDLIIIHCSATRADSDFSAQDVDTAHRYRGFSSWGYH